MVQPIINENLKMNNRDNFTQATIDKLSRKVANLCSNPECRILVMSAKAQGNQGVANLGVAAHICAASPNGPRYDSAMTTEERKHENNGIWLCQNCARLIDIEPDNHPKELLLEWKSEAAKFARSKLGIPLFNWGNKEKTTEQIYRENDIEFVQNYLNFVPFTKIPYLLQYLPNSINIDLFTIGEMWEHACIDMPHLCNLRDKKLDEYFKNFFFKYYELYGLVRGHLSIKNEKYEQYIHHFEAPYIFRGTIFLNEDLPYEYLEDLCRDIEFSKNEFHKTYEDLIAFFRNEYPEINLAGVEQV